MPRERTNILIAPFAISYNGIDIPYIHKKNLTEEAVYDTDNRYIRYYRYTLEVEFFLVPADFESSVDINSGVSTDNTVAFYRLRLMDREKTLILDNTGLGPEYLVVTGEPLTGPTYVALRKRGGNAFVVTDAANGPIPLSFVARPIASNNCMACKWVIQYHYHPGSLNYSGGQIVPANVFRYKTELFYDESGLLTRVVEGELEIPGNLPRTGTTAAHLRDYIYQRIPFLARLEGFRRTQRILLNEDMRNARFYFQDKELPSENPLYPGTVHMDIEHTVESKLFTTESISDPGGWTKWLNRLNGTITLRPTGGPPGVGRFLAWLAFTFVLNERTKVVRTSPVSIKVGAPVGADKQNEHETTTKERLFILSASITENIYTRTFRFSVTYLVVTSPLRLFSAIRMFHTLDILSWAEWQDSMNGELLKPTRRSNLYYQWAPTQPVDTSVGTGDTMEILNDLPPGKIDPEPSIINFMSFTAPPPEDSYAAFDSQFEVEENTNTIQHTRYLPQPEDKYSTAQVQGESRAIHPGFEIEDFSQNPASTPVSEQHVLQSRAKNEYRLRTYGYAVRVGYPVPMPRLAQFGNQKAYREPGSRWFHKMIGVTSTGLPVFLGAWDSVYTILGDPASGGDLAPELARMAEGNTHYYKA